jgi:hypothetical protein
VADLVFAFDPAIDRPIPSPDALPPALAEALARAPLEALAATFSEARRGAAVAVVICGRLLDPGRASPAQAAAVRRLVIDAAADGCRTVVVLHDAAHRHELARMLGDPPSLSFVTSAAGVDLDVRGLAVEIVSAFDATAGDLPDPQAAALHRRIVVGWDHGLWHGMADGSPPAADEPDATLVEHPRDAFSYAPTAAAAHPHAFWLWGSRRCQMLPPGVHHLPALQPRSGHEGSAGACCRLTLVNRADTVDGAAAVRPEWRSSWREHVTQRVGWRTLTVESPTGGDEELATAIWSAMEALVPAGRTTSGDAATVLELVRCAVACGTNVARRVRVGEIASETLARVRQLYDARSFPIWCTEVFADVSESLGPLGHARSGSRPGSTTSFSSALADIVTAIEEADEPLIPPALAREAGWMGLELVESTD